MRRRSTPPIRRSPSSCSSQTPVERTPTDARPQCGCSPCSALPDTAAHSRRSARSTSSSKSGCSKTTTTAATAGRGLPTRVCGKRVRSSLRPGHDRNRTTRLTSTSVSSTVTARDSKPSGTRPGTRTSAACPRSTRASAHAFAAPSRTAVPAGAVVLVAAKGDDELLAFTDRSGWHFPGNLDGSFLGEYPADSASAIEMLERSREAGATYVAFPNPSAWWLEHYAGLRAHLVATWGPPVIATSDLTMWSLDEPRRTDGRIDDRAEGVAAHRRRAGRSARAHARRGRNSPERAHRRGRPRRRRNTRPTTSPCPQSDSGPDLAASLRETWHVLDRALEEGGASKHTRYLLLSARLRAQLVALTPPGSTIAVVSRGDDDLLALPDRVAWHVPGCPTGRGRPASRPTARKQFVTWRSCACSVPITSCCPATYAWWLDTYRELAEHLETQKCRVAGRSRSRIRLGPPRRRQCRRFMLVRVRRHDDPAPSRGRRADGARLEHHLRTACALSRARRVLAPGTRVGAAVPRRHGRHRRGRPVFRGRGRRSDASGGGRSRAPAGRRYPSPRPA